ncbi:putative HNHc nuclease [Sphingomonas piscis]|uniref:DUF968 domain-containing protein n=1 Tax=Sphingomonas piscis TaxID=2714943 RepID=UPI0031B5CBB8
MARLPRYIKRVKAPSPERSCPAHRAWVRRHACSVPGCANHPCECAHVRRGTDGGTALKPSDRWVISLCPDHHMEQHRIGEPAFERKHGICMAELAEEFARRSPHCKQLCRTSG